MTATHSIAPTLLVAIDISKHRHEVLIGIPGKTRRHRLTITNKLEDFRRLAATLSAYELPVLIGFEATGSYHRPLASPWPGRVRPEANVLRWSGRDAGSPPTVWDF